MCRYLDIWNSFGAHGFPSVVGKRWFRGMLDRVCRREKSFAQASLEAGNEVSKLVVLNQVLVSFGSDDFTELATQSIQQDGDLLVGISLERASPHAGQRKLLGDKKRMWP
jgi:hypothetical protein